MGFRPEVEGGDLRVVPASGASSGSRDGRAPRRDERLQMTPAFLPGGNQQPRQIQVGTRQRQGEALAVQRARTPDDRQRPISWRDGRRSPSPPTTPEDRGSNRQWKEKGLSTPVDPSIDSLVAPDEVCWCPWCQQRDENGVRVNLVLGGQSHWFEHLITRHEDKLGGDVGYRQGTLVPCYWCCRPCVTEEGQELAGNYLPLWGSHERVCRENPNRPTLRDRQAQEARSMEIRGQFTPSFYEDQSLEVRSDDRRRALAVAPARAIRDVNPGPPPRREAMGPVRNSQTATSRRSPPRPNRSRQQSWEPPVQRDVASPSKGDRPRQPAQAQAERRPDRRGGLTLERRRRAL